MAQFHKNMATVEEVKNAFSTSGYVHLPGLFKTEDCARLTDALHAAVSSGEFNLDDQCPSSPAVHGQPEFDSLLEQLTPYFEEASGKKLLPTYSYARLYRNGEVLKPHTDRPACEISATITLGGDGTAWPIYMADPATESFSVPVGKDGAGNEMAASNINAVGMSVGDAVLYRGTEKIHWRNAFSGEWRAQVFLHYVDADGAHADQKYDGRKSLSHHVVPETKVTNDIYYWTFDAALNPAQCTEFVSSMESCDTTHEAGIGSGKGGVVDKNVRDVGRICIPPQAVMSTMMAGYGFLANKQSWKFDVTHHNQTDYLRYDTEGHYQPHLDTFMDPSEPECRKLTILLFLNNDFEGGRLFLQFGQNRIYPPQEAGTVLVFPSFLLHGVEPVTVGVRRSVVTWLVGPWFK